jgi:hypothetical protein
MHAMKEKEEPHVKATAVCRRLTLAETTQTGSATFVTHTHTHTHTLSSDCACVRTRPPLFTFSEAGRRAGAAGVGVLPLESACHSWPLTSETRFQSCISPHTICGGQSGTDTGFSQTTSVYPVSITPPTQHAHSFINYQCYLTLWTHSVVQCNLKQAHYEHQVSTGYHSSTTETSWCRLLK